MNRYMVPMRFRNWSFFDKQRSVFRDMFKDMEKEFAELDKELEHMRKAISTDMGSMDIIGRTENNPIITDKDGNKHLSLRFDCKGYKPDEITVKTVDNKLILEAKQSEETPGKKSFKSFTRQYELPNKIDPSTLNSTLTADGILTIEAPAPQAIEEAPRERILPIKYLD